MNIFTAIGQVLNTLTNTTVNALETIDTAVDSIHDVAKMSKATTSGMLAEMEHENAMLLKEMEEQGKE